MLDRLCAEKEMAEDRMILDHRIAALPRLKIDQPFCRVGRFHKFPRIAVRAGRPYAAVERKSGSRLIIRLPEDIRAKDPSIDAG